MLETRTPPEQLVKQGKSEKLWVIAIACLVGLETLLVVLALVPAQLWVHFFPLSSSASLDGPFPPVIAPLITIVLYILPALIGWLSRTWQRALLGATLPAWLGLGAFLVAATFKIGAFYLVSPDHISANVAVLELFAVLGGIGWLGRFLYKMR